MFFFVSLLKCEVNWSLSLFLSLSHIPAFGGEKWKTNVLLTAFLCPGWVNEEIHNFFEFKLLNVTVGRFGPFCTLKSCALRCSLYMACCE